MSELIFQADSGSLDGSLDPKLGIVALRLKCWAPDLLTAITGTAPGLPVALVETQPRTFSRLPGGEQAGYDVLISVEGHLSPDAADGEEFALDAATSEDPIESHPEYQLLLDTYGGEEDASTNRAKWPKTLAVEEQDLRNPMHGVESYLVAGLTWTRKSVAQSLKASIVRALSTVETPPGNPPELTGRRNWLKVRARATYRGNIWLIEESWMLSGPDGWVPEMYRLA